MVQANLCRSLREIIFFNIIILRERACDVSGFVYYFNLNTKALIKKNMLFTTTLFNNNMVKIEKTKSIYILF